MKSMMISRLVKELQYQERGFALETGHNLEWLGKGGGSEVVEDEDERWYL